PMPDGPTDVRDVVSTSYQYLLLRPVGPRRDSATSGGRACRRTGNCDGCGSRIKRAPIEGPSSPNMHPRRRKCGFASWRQRGEIRILDIGSRGLEVTGTVDRVLAVGRIGEIHLPVLPGSLSGPNSERRWTSFRITLTPAGPYLAAARMLRKPSQSIRAPEE